MARYTVELGNVVKSGVKIFDFPYEFYDEAKRADFEDKFIKHFYFREIGVETVGRFVHYLECKCNETLPFYNMLWRTAMIDYQKTINYSLTETYTRDVDKTDNVTGTAHNDGTNTGTATNNNTLTRNANITATGDKTNTLESDTNHSDDINFSKDSTTSVTDSIDKTSTLTIDGKKVESDTPSGLLSMTNIKNDVYASKADLENTTNKTVDTQTTQDDKTDTSTETTNQNTIDSVNATSTDKTTDTTKEDTTETNTGTNTNNTNFVNNGTTTQNGTGTENETSVRTTKGSYGVITEADMLQKHINLQQTLSTILSKFLNECEDLFMQIY